MCGSNMHYVRTVLVCEIIEQLPEFKYVEHYDVKRNLWKQMSLVIKTRKHSIMEKVAFRYRSEACNWRRESLKYRKQQRWGSGY